MHNHVDHRWIQTLLRKIISVLLIYSIFFSSQANAAVGGWDLKNPVAQGASTVYDATKNVVINGKKFIKESSVKITPTATSVAKVLARGGAGYALSVAVEQLLGSVDWVLDPANNRIKYFIEPTDPNNPAIQYLWSDGRNKFATAKEALESSCRGYRGSSYVGISNLNVTTDRATATCLSSDGLSDVGSSVQRVNNPAYNPNAEREEKYLPLDVVAQKVISNAQGGDSAAQQATTAAAADIVAEAETDNAKARPIVSQAEANATTKPADAAEAEKANEAQGQSKPNQVNPEAIDISIEFPVFCNWAPLVCEAAQKTINMASNMSGWFNDVIQAQEKTEQTIKTEASKTIASTESVKNSIDIGNRELKGELVNAGSAVKDVETAVKDGTTELKGELVNAGSAVKDVEKSVKDGTTELKGELVNTGSAVKDVEKSVKDGTTELKGELVNTGSAVKDVETAVKDGTTTLQGELVNTGSAVKDVETAVKDGTTTLQGELVNTGEKIDSVKDEVSEVKEEVKSLSEKLTEAWEAAKEWAKNDENLDSDNETPEIKEIDIGALDTSTFKGVAGCPAPIQVPINFGTGGETQISYEPICQLADKWSFVAPLIGFLSGAMILVGVGRKGEDGEI